MKLKNCLFILNIGMLCLFSTSVLAQTDTAFLSTKKQNTEISILPDTNVLYRWQVSNEVIITSTNSNKPISQIKGINMEVEKLGKDKYRLIPHHSDTVVHQSGKLLVFCLNSKGKQQVQLIKEYGYINPPMPRLTIGGIFSDSVISAKTILVNN